MSAAVAIVLAGGASRRFGSNKLAAGVRGAPLLHHALHAVAEVADEIVLVVGPGDVPPALPPGLRAPVRIAHDPERYGGPLVGLATGLAVVEDPEAIVLLAAGDMPTLQPVVLRLLADAVRADPAAELAVLEHDPFAPFPVALRPAPARAAAGETLSAGRRSLFACFGRLRQVVVAADVWRALDPAAATVRDVDRPDSLP